MTNWIPLNEIEYRKVWDRLNNDFNFEPSISKFPSFHSPSPYNTYDISSIWGSLEHDELYLDLENKFLLYFQELTQHDEYLFALDWQHECYLINAFKEFPRDDLDRWIIPAVPDGDYYFFIQKEFKWGILSHPWEKTITVFGNEILEVLKKNKPKLFHTIVREG
jgi:hypothetical protein